MDTKKLFKVLVLGGMLAVGVASTSCGGTPEGQGAQLGNVTDGGGTPVADGGIVRNCVWGGDPCPC